MDVPALQWDIQESAASIAESCNRIAGNTTPPPPLWDWAMPSDAIYNLGVDVPEV